MATYLPATVLGKFWHVAAPRSDIDEITSLRTGIAEQKAADCISAAMRDSAGSRMIDLGDSKEVIKKDMSIGSEARCERKYCRVTRSRMRQEKAISGAKVLL